DRAHRPRRWRAAAGDGPGRADRRARCRPAGRRAAGELFEVPHGRPDLTTPVLRMPLDPAQQPPPGPGLEPAGGRRRWPWPRKNTPEQVRERQRRLRELPHWDRSHDFVWDWPHPPEEYAGLLEALTAHVVLPVSFVGPLRLELGRYRV